MKLDSNQKMDIVMVVAQSIKQLCYDLVGTEIGPEGSEEGM